MHHPCSDPSLLRVCHASPTSTIVDICNNSMVQERTRLEAETQDTATPDMSTVPTVEGIAGTVLCQVEERYQMAEDERRVGNWNKPYW